MPTVTRDKKVVETVRRAVVKTAREAEVLKNKTSHIADRVVNFGKDVTQGVNEGIAEIRKNDGR
ncbi:MAG: hypothetical protein ACREGR_02560 [Minisyncoccia bacterium]